ncbi:MAG TPA: FAD/NAD(P)-binding oxidoreductase [Solirubrobacterales bacterium]|nr:FAD/NAD(P)-binding oxidoreductase [Solirubrobacterales bacterium]
MPKVMAAGKTKVVIVGGGLGGLACARRLARHHDKLDICLVDRKTNHDFPPSFPWVTVRRRRAGNVSRPLEQLVRRGIRFTQAEVTGIDLDRGAISTISGKIPYDQLVLAPGATLTPESVDGLAEAAHGFYTLPDAERLRDALVTFGGGRVLIAVVAAPYRSLAAPYEAAFLINDFLRKRDVPAKVDVATAEPRPIPAADHEVGDRVAATLERRGIGFQADRLLESVDPAAREARFSDGSEPFDLLIAIPPHRAPGFIAVSPLAGPNGWIRAAPFSLSVHSNVYAIGDVTEIELAGGAKLPKAGVLAQAEAAVVADNIATTAAGYRPRREFDGSLDYYLELGSGRAARAKGDFYRSARGRLRFRRPARRWHRAKVLFERRSLRQLR